MIDRRVERPAWMERETFFERAVKLLVLTLISVLVIYPFITVVATSLATQEEITRNGGLIVLWPRQPSLGAYKSILAGGIVTRATMVSIGVTVVGTLLSLVTTTAMAYALSRPIVFGRAILMLVLFTLLFAPGIIPNYLVVKQLGLLNTYAALILPVMISAFNLVVMRQFFMGIPQELIDSARIDGAGDLKILTHIVLPLSGAVIAVVALFYAVAYWNAFFNAMLYLNDNGKWPLQLVLRNYVVQAAPIPGIASTVDDGGLPPAEAMHMAVLVVALVPILLLYPFLQRYFTRGVLSGAIKG
ncbi:MAG: carbohydrate ABC transporter permease [Chloroflexota bacterium]